MAILEAIGEFFATVFKAIWSGICAFFGFIWSIICTIVAWVVEYFFVYLPVLVIGGFAIFWICNPEYSDPGALITFNLLEDWGYEWNLTNMAAEWLVNTEPNILLLIIGAFKLVVLVVTAVLETVIVYLIFGFIGTIISAVIYFVVNIMIWFILPAAGAVYSCIMLKNSQYHNRWFYLLCSVLTIIAAVICYIFAFSALG